MKLEKLIMTTEKLSKRSASTTSLLLALIFMLKIFSSRIFSLPQFRWSHFGKRTLQRQMKLEQMQRNVIKHRASLKFLKAGRVVYYLTPKFIRFKLYRPDLQFAKRFGKFRKQLLVKELECKEKNLSRLLQLEIKFRSCLFTEVGWLSSLYVKKFLGVVHDKDEKRIFLTVSNKLKRLGVNLGLEMKDEPQVVFNLSDRQLSKTEFDPINKGLDFAHFPLHLSIPRIRVEFEYLYRQIRSFLSASNRLLFKQKLMTLYSRFTGNFFQQQRKHSFSLSDEQFKALQNLKQDKSIIVSRLDKGNGVFVMNKSSYLSKMYDILSDSIKF